MATTTEDFKDRVLNGESPVFVDYVEYKIPSWVVGYIVNGDSDLDEKYLRVVDDFLHEVVEGFGYGIWEFEEEEYFSYDNDVTTLGDDVYDATYFIYR